MELYFKTSPHVSHLYFRERCGAVLLQSSENMDGKTSPDYPPTGRVKNRYRFQRSGVK